MVNELLSLLKGRRTYIVAIAMAGAVFAYGVGLIDQHTFLLIEGVLAPGGLAALRSGTSNDIKEALK